jgi:hypothetical protein
MDGDYRFVDRRQFLVLRRIIRRIVVRDQGEDA